MFQAELLLPTIYGFLLLFLGALYILFSWLRFPFAAIVVVCVAGILTGSVFFQYDWAPFPFFAVLSGWVLMLRTSRFPFGLKVWYNPLCYCIAGFVASLVKTYLPTSKTWILTFFLLILIVFLMGQLCLAMERKEA